MFILEGVSKRFGGLQALHPLSLTLPKGATSVLIGPSGCGKSTLLRLLNGLSRPDTGRVLFDGQPLATEEDALLAVRQRVGYALQGGGLFPHLTGAQNVTLMARHLRWPEARIRERLGVLMDLTRFPADALERFPGQLSGGQRQRVALMRALMLDPDVLLLDEPLGALDPLVRHDLQADLRGIFERLGKTVVLVTHDLAEAAYLGDRIVLMRDGQVVQQGTLEDLESRPGDAFVTRFIQAQRPLPVGRSG
ncbi:ATP-binding cassette domain-containing protein [Corallococcus praedator]|uniref:ATP-binding cassette domain-containing protein n=1 Tax=Corallococcus praedator TaxID=2316724 RepID=A0ABX9QAC7_9BACT|nr:MULTISPECIES: ATP-binding cassette domain-containing protein [Corallococcus]RKH11676.1 ATP-binding cassette domain-containing protein [Corallococcus sp. CA047B]RKH31987.1 ATP-binding cassette domain-containing protein [Corallococcus sp. CA031C]RKH96448.1 ATP-binding cassette domain-containing protein [Corallococcus praedator]